MNTSLAKHFHVYSMQPSAAWLSSDGIDQRIDASYYSTEYLPLDVQLSDKPEQSVVPLHRLLVEPRRVLYMNTDSYSAKDRPPGAIPFVSGVDLDSTTMSITWDGVQHVDAWMADKYPKGLLFPGAILIKVKGPHQSVVYIEKCSCPALVSGTIFFAGVKSVDPYYLQAYLASSSGVQWRTRLRTNITVEFVSNDELKEVPVFLPAREVQAAIGNLLRKAERLRELARVEWQRSNSEIDRMFDRALPSDGRTSGWITGDSLESDRIDSWFNQPLYIDFFKSLHSRGDLAPVGAFADLLTTPARFESDREHFDYYEISDLGSETNSIVSKSVPFDERPSRAKYEVSAGDILISTVRPNLKAVAIVPDGVQHAVCSSGFSVVRAPDVPTAYYLRACLLHDLSTLQLMRWNTGALYPAIDRSVPLRVLVPQPESDRVQEIGRALHHSAKSYALARTLTERAKFSVESLIYGTLDDEVVLAESAEIERWLKKNPSPMSSNQA